VASISYIDYYLPNDSITIDDYFKSYKNFVLPKQYNSLEELQGFFKEACGFKKLFVEDKNSKTSVFSNLVSDYFKKTKVDPKDIAYVIHTDFFGFQGVDGLTVADQIQTQFGLVNASCFVISQHCSASSMAIELALQLCSPKNKYVMILSSTHIMELEERYVGFSLVGDSASIMVISDEPGNYDIVNYATFSNVSSAGDVYKTGHKYRSQESSVFYATKFIKKFLTSNDLNISDVYMMVFQNLGNELLVDIYGKALKITEKNLFLDNIPNGGHSGNVDIVRNLKDLATNHNPPNGAYVLVIAVGITRKTQGMKFHFILLRCNKN
jgi:3-oxoacyl-[acyl-carrier-protein] synthase III